MYRLHYRRLADWGKIIDKIEKGERKIHRLRDIRDIIQYKIELHLESVYKQMYPGVEEGKVAKVNLEQHSPWDLLLYSWPKMEFKYGGGQRGFSYQKDEDAFLLVMMHRHGFGAARRIQLEIRRAWQFRFNWFFKSRSPEEIQKRCDTLVRKPLAFQSSLTMNSIDCTYVSLLWHFQIKVVEREVKEHREMEAAKEEEEQQKKMEDEEAKKMEVDNPQVAQPVDAQATVAEANMNKPTEAPVIDLMSSD